jgi:hypothetical protein
VTSRRKPRAASNSAAFVRKMIFGPAPILENEDSAEYEFLLQRHYTDAKPKDIAEESYLHDGTYWTWELRRLRRMKICLIEAARTNAMAWVLAMPRSVRLRYIRGTSEADIKKSAEPGSLAAEIEPISEEAMAIRKDEFYNNFGLMEDTITTRAFLEELELVERIDRAIAIAENRRNAAYREIHRHRAALSHAEREKIRIIDDAEFNVIQLGKNSAKRKQQKMRHDQRTQN